MECYRPAFQIKHERAAVSRHDVKLKFKRLSRLSVFSRRTAPITQSKISLKFVPQIIHGISEKRRDNMLQEDNYEQAHVDKGDKMQKKKKRENTIKSV